MTTPRTAAGRRHVSALVGLLGGEDWWTTSVLAIEAEARAAALDAVAPLLDITYAEGYKDGRAEAQDAAEAWIDALRERSGDVLMVTAPDFGQQYSTRGALIRHTTKRERS